MQKSKIVSPTLGRSKKKVNAMQRGSAFSEILNTPSARTLVQFRPSEWTSLILMIFERSKKQYFLRGVQKMKTYRFLITLRKMILFKMLLKPLVAARILKKRLTTTNKPLWGVMTFRQRGNKNCKSSIPAGVTEGWTCQVCTTIILIQQQ